MEAVQKNSLKVDWYAGFFLFIALSFISFVCYVSWIEIYHDYGLVGIPMIFLCSFGVIGFTSNLGGQNSSAKEVFFGGISFFVFCVVCAMFGYVEVNIWKFFTG